MKKSIFQKLADRIKDLGTPKWLVKWLDVIQDIIVQLIYSVGKAYLEDIKAKIIEISDKPISNEEKFKEVFTYARISLNMNYLKDSSLNLLIELIVNSLKKKGTI